MTQIDFFHSDREDARDNNNMYVIEMITVSPISA